MRGSSEMTRSAPFRSPSSSALVARSMAVPDQVGHRDERLADVVEFVVVEVTHVMSIPSASVARSLVAQVESWSVHCVNERRTAGEHRSVGDPGD